MQPTVQSEQDKMVPIDTSGDPVEVEVKEEEKVNESPEIEVQEGQVSETKKEEESLVPPRSNILLHQGCNDV